MSDIKRVPLTTHISGGSSSSGNSTTIINNNKKTNIGGILQNNRFSAATPSIISTLAASSISYSSTAAAMMSTTAISAPSSSAAGILLTNQSGSGSNNNNNSGNNSSNNNVTSISKNLKTLRLAFELFEPNSDSFPEFNYSKLMYVEKKKLKKIKEKRNGLSDPFEENDDDVARIAKEMERKYGNYCGTSRKNDLCDKGYGYDESDSFIDNTENYDEVIPDEVETVEGGFYINSGQLEFKHLSKYEKETEEMVKMVKSTKKKQFFESSSSESDDSDDSDDDDEEDDSDDTAAEIDTEEKSSKNSNNKIRNGHANKRHKSSGEQHESSSSSSSKSKSKSTNNKHQDKLSNKITAQKDIKKIDNVVVVSGLDKTACVSTITDANNEKTIKTTTVKDMLKAKRDNFLKMQDDKVKLNGSKSENDSSDTSEEDSDSDDNEPSQKKLKTSADGQIDDPEKLRTSDSKLPDDLSTDLFKYIKEMKDTAKLNNRIGKNFQFDTQMTDIFFKIDDATICIDKSIRNQVFAHIEYQLILPKYYLLRKAKQLRIKQEKHKIKKSYLKLKKSVADVMPSVKNSYETTYAKVEEMRSKIPPEELQKMDKPPKFPKKKFPWNDSIRNLLYDLYQVRWTSYTVLRTRKETFEEFVNNFLKDKVVSIWPTGWMKYDELKKELEKRKNATKKPKDIKKTNNETTQITSSSSTIQTVQNKSIDITSSTGNTNNNKSSLNVNQISNMPKSVLSTANKSLPVVVGSNDLVVTISSGNGNSSGISGSGCVGGSGNSENILQNSISIIPVPDTNDNKTTSKTHNTVKKSDNKQNNSSSNKLDISNSNAGTSSSSSNKSNVIDLISPTKRTDHSINSIISGSPTSSTSSQHSRTSPNLIEPTTTTTTSSTTHIITVDNYKNTSDIINTSKTILFNNNQNYNNNNNPPNNTNIQKNNISPKENSIRISSVSSINKSVELKSIRRNTVDSISSNGSSDDVEIVGCYTNPKKQSITNINNATTSSLSTIIKKNKYTKNKNRSDSPSSIILHNKIKTESKSNNSNNNHSSSSGSGNCISLKSKNNSSTGIKKKNDYDKANESESDNKDSDIDVNQIINSLKELEEMQQKSKKQFESNSHSSSVSFNKDIKQ